MTAAQLVALRMLATSPRRTSKLTTDRVISGRVAACLVRMGLAERRSLADAFEIHITKAGHAALAKEQS